MCCGNENIVIIGSAEKTCMNPIAYLVGLAVKESEVTGDDIVTVLTSIITQGLVSKKDGLLCCPNCDTVDGFYFLGNTTSLGLLVTGLTSWTSFTGNVSCCVNYEASLNSSTTIEAALASIQSSSECCNTLLTTELGLLFEKYPSVRDILMLGVVEISSLNSKTSFSEIVNIILEEKPYADEGYIYSVLLTLLTVGIVVKCSDCKISIGRPNDIESIMNIIL